MRLSLARATRALVALSLTGGLAACGDDEPTPPASDTGIDATDTTDATDGDAPDSESDTSPGPDATPDAVADTDTTPDEPDATTDVAIDTDTDDVTDPSEPTGPVADCDPIDPSFCALPWPSNLYLVPDARRETGVTLAFGPTTLPANRQGRTIDPRPYRRLDGYGLGAPIMTVFPQEASLENFPTEETIAFSIDPASSSSLFRVTDGGLERVPHFVELDATEDDPEAPRLVFLRPAVILAPATRYVVAFHGLVDDEGAAVAPTDAFVALRDGLASDDPAITSRQAAMADLVADLTDAGIPSDSLFLAWDFITASEDALHRRIDQGTALAMDAIGEEGAPLTFDDVRISVPADDGTGAHVDEYVAIRVNATMTTPSIVRSRPGLGFQLALDENGDVVRADDMNVAVRIQVPHRALAGDPVGVIVYGHGLLGNQDEIAAGHLRRIGEELGYILVATPLRGMSADDAATVLATTTNMSNFEFFGDGLHQGIVQTHVLARTAITRLPDMLADIDGNITVDTDRLYWFGGSQGGIFGTTILATSPDMERGVLAVGGNNYSTMLQRSTNFTPYFDSLARSYPSTTEVAILIAMAQLMWDFTDPISYWRRLLEDPSPAGAPRDALLLLSKSDKQVPVLTNEIAARTFPQIQVMAPYDNERTPWDVELVDYPTTGSAMVLFDFGNPWPTGRGNRPPNDPGRDPHPRIAEVDETAGLIESFLDTRTIIDVCGGDVCFFGP